MTAICYVIDIRILAINNTMKNYFGIQCKTMFTHWLYQIMTNSNHANTTTDFQN